MTEPFPGLRRDVPLAPFTTLGVGGGADYFFEAGDVPAARRALSWATDHGLPVFLLGGGSNVVIADQGWPGLVLRFCAAACSVTPEGDDVLVRAGAGFDWDDFVQAMVAEGFAGLECLSGIPGLVGGAPIQNIGAYGQEVAQTIESVEVLDRRSLTARTFTMDDCGFGYRQSRFKGDLAGRFLVTEVCFRLRRDGAPVLSYPELQRRATQLGTGAASLVTVRDLVLELRRSKAMVLDPTEPDSCSVGSFFMNPLLSASELYALEAALEGSGTDPAGMPRYDAGSDLTKVPAAWLIEQAGFVKGETMGRAAISTKHSLALVNRGGASAADILGLARTVRTGVRDRLSVVLQPEPRFIGFDRPVAALLDDGPQKG